MDIDEIFKDVESVTKTDTKKNNTINNTKKNTNTIKNNRKYVDGLPIYSLEELNIGKGGDTPDCPFDCDCCY